MTIEQQVIEQLSNYRQKKARIMALSTYSVGAGITVSRLNEDDHLQELHRKLRGLTPYMYLSKHEQKLESVAHVYITGYPAGVKAQKQAVPVQVMDPEDTELLQELRRKIQKVIEARGYDIRNGIEAIIERLTELQDLQAEIDRIDFILSTLEEYKPYAATLMRWIYVEGMELQELTEKLEISESTVRRRIRAAEREYVNLAR
ncbi:MULTISPECIES: RNA polymerase subunit sigma-24 [Paenibacillus]|uniref:RNA polymerase subunit sigma-24 n=1 Tax=Paenibacillus lautus TaxID=1401 RepID=A0A1R1ALR3_PAELA|nr:RNA polymerase subunit sigma-24 [Paenibacillus lautus]OME86515.1 RNA polymerase subunit sigma-24 [Paenibacillus lautus]